MEQYTREQVRTVLKQYGEDTLSYFHLQDERRYFFSPTGQSFLSFKLHYKVAVVASDPVGDLSEIPLLLSTFITYCETWGLKPLFVAFNKQFLPLLMSLQFQTLKIGEEAVVDISTFKRDLLKKKVRRAVRHIEQQGVEVFFYTPLTIPESILSQIMEISNAWLSKNGKKEKGYIMTLKRLPDKSDVDCQYVIAIQNNVVIGFLCLMPVYGDSSLSLDYVRRKDNTHNGLTEFLIIKSAEYYQRKGIKNISLNFATFTDLLDVKYSLKKKMYYILLKPIKIWYKVDTLREFNQKFMPQWHGRYIAYTSLKHMPRYLLALLKAER